MSLHFSDKHLQRAVSVQAVHKLMKVTDISMNLFKRIFSFLVNTLFCFLSE